MILIASRGKSEGNSDNITYNNSHIAAGNQVSISSDPGANIGGNLNVTLAATGAGKDSDLTVRGSDIKAGGTTTLKADDAVSIVAAQNTTTESNSSKSSSGSIGIGMQFGSGSGSQAGVTVSASVRRGQGAGNSTTYSNSHITADQVSLQSGGDTTVKGGVIKAEQSRPSSKAVPVSI